MAFSKQPEIATYSTKQVPLVHQYNSRAASTSKDVDYLNVYFESVQNKETKESFVDVYTRPGYATFSDPLQSTNVRRAYYWEEEQKWYVWVDDDLQIINGATGAITTTLTAVLGTSSGDVGVTEFLYDSGEVKLVFTDGLSLKTIDAANTIVASADVDLPSPILTSLVFLDGYLFLVDADNQDIINSNLNDPLAFTAGDFISAEMQPDTMMGIAKLNNYLLAFGKNSIEYFWDAANATGSPLQRNDTPVKFNSIIDMNTVATYGNKMYFLGSSLDTGAGLFMLEDFKIKPVGNEGLRKQLLPLIPAFWSGSVISVNGHDFYVLTGSSCPTFVVDLNNPELWTRWQEAGGTNLFIRNAATTRQDSLSDCIFYVDSKQYLFKFDPAVTTDAEVSYNMHIITPREDFDSYNQKVINRLTVVGDRPSANTTMSISWTDDDYQTYQTAQTTNLNQELPCIYQLGGFRRRAFKLTCTPTVPFRLRHLEVDINLGNS